MLLLLLLLDKQMLLLFTISIYNFLYAYGPLFRPAPVVGLAIHHIMLEDPGLNNICMAGTHMPGTQTCWPGVFLVCNC